MLISEQHRETFKPTGGNCLCLIIMYIHMHLVMFPATNNIDSLDTPFTTDPPVVKAVAKQKCVFVCARSPSAMGFPCMSSRARVTGGLWSRGACNGALGSVLQARR